MPVAPLTTLRVGPVASQADHLRHHRQARRRAARTARRRPRRPHAGAGRRLQRRDRRRPDRPDRRARWPTPRSPSTATVVRAEAGASWDDVVVTSLAHGLGGLECLSGIPGSAGATPGAERRRVRRRGRRRHQPRPAAGPPHRRGALGGAGASCGFGYRTSVLKHSSRRRRARGRVRPGRRGPQRAAAIRRAGRRRSASNPVRGPSRPWCASAVLALRAGKGMVLDDARPRHLERRLVLHQPRRVAPPTSPGCAPRSTARCRTTPPRTG